MSDRLLTFSHLGALLIDSDPIFRLGLRIALEASSSIKVVGDVSNDSAALQLLGDTASSQEQTDENENSQEPKKDHREINLIVLELGRNSQEAELGLQFCEQLKALYPHIPVLLLTAVSNSETLLTAKNLGVNGYCPKGISISLLVGIMEEIAKGGYYWWEKNPSKSLDSPLTRWTHKIHSSGISYITRDLTKITLRLRIPGIPLLERVILAGHRRELLAAGWLVHQLFGSSEPQPVPRNRGESESVPIASSPLQTKKALQSIIFTSCLDKLQFPLPNIGEVPLEMDILREEKKKELLYLILQKLSQRLDKLRDCQFEISQLSNLKKEILYDLWEGVVREFYGQIPQVNVGKSTIETVGFLLDNARGVETEILDKIPLVEELLSYLIWQTDLYVDNRLYSPGSESANYQILMILENLLIQIANGVLQPLINLLADVETVKQHFYDRHFISTREIERFRNNLSWKYWLTRHFGEPQAIFESRYELFVIAPRGITKTSIYSPRNHQLANLSGIPLVVTLALEFRDAIAPRLQSLLSFVGNVIVFVLTKIVGRGLGLIARGVLQGLGSVNLGDKPGK
jgi:DNA-binding NarL/FixJ family response regulator